MADVRYASVTQPGNGVKINWDFNFSGAAGTPGYLDKTHVKAFKTDPNGGRTDIPVTAGMFVSATQLQITPAIPTGWTVTIYRSTPKDAPLVDFATTAILSEAVLDQSARQAIYVAAETVDAFADTKTVVDGVQGNVAAAQAAQAGAEAAQAAALVSQNAAASSAASAAAQVPLATARAVASANSASQSSGFATASQNSATVSAASAAAAAATYLGFDQRYLGAKATAPTLDNQGAALAAGAVYYNTTVPQWFVYDLTLGWQVPTNNVLRTGSGAPTAGIGFNGDTYYDFTNYAVYGPKAAGAWGSGTSLIGPSGPGTGDVTGPAASLDSEVALFGGSTGKAIKRSALTAAVVRIVSGVMQAATAAVHYVAPGAIASANGLTMATSRLLGRTSVSTGAVEEISVGAGMTLDSGVLSVVPAGSTLLATITPTVSTFVDALTLFSGSYDNYTIIIEGVKPTVDDVLRLRFAVGGVVNSTPADYGRSNAFVTINSTAAVSTGNGISATMTLINANAAAGSIKAITLAGVSHRTGTTYDPMSAPSQFVAGAVSGIRLYWDSASTFQATGVIRIYGISNT